MAKVKMKKIEIIAFFKDCRSIMERLQRRGATELTDVSDEKLVKINSDSNTARLERTIALVLNARASLEHYCPEEQPLGKILSGRKQITTAEFAQKAEKNGDTLKMCVKINSCVSRIGELKNNIARLNAKIDSLTPWLSLKLPQNFTGTENTAAFSGTLPGETDLELVKSEIKKDSTLFFAKEISARKEQKCIFALCLKEESERVLAMLRDFGFMQNSALSPLTYEEEKKKCVEERARSEKELNETTEIIKAFGKNREEIDFLEDYLVMKKDKYEAFSKLAMTESVFVLNGYIPEKYCGKLAKEFESKYELCISFSDPDDDEDVPVLLSNSSFSEPLEGITEMYALPNKRDVDPSSVMSFFYYLFFGMMLSDAGYGLIMLIATTVILKKTSVEGNLRKSIKMFRNCGVSTVFWGALFGSWFGDLPQVIASSFFGKNIETTALWFEPLDDPMKLLLFSFGLGICHLFLGLWVNFRMLLKEGRPFDAFCEVFPIYFTILGVAPICAGILTPVPSFLITRGKYLAIIGVILIVLTSGRSGKNIFMRFFGGIYGLYNVATGYLGDILSYSRLLALGLATGSIASVINLIAAMPQNTVLKAIMLIVVGIAGHTANLGINMLGAYVHADRLQFVELFSKFYEGGGRKFEPLKSNTKHIKFEKENIYE